jgi:glycosyltransferase involved in cell wall biosynthesis
VEGNAFLPRFFNLNFPGKKTLIQFLTSHHLDSIKVVINKKVDLEKIQGVVSIHESLDSVTTAMSIGEKFGLKRIVVLQLPPFYGDKDRMEKIKEAIRLWFNIMGIAPYKQFLGSLLQKFIEISKTMESLINKFNLILAVSTSIPIEMGDKWIQKVVSLDPGVALSQEDIKLINIISQRETMKKEKFAIFGGRPSPEKGIIEALMSWKNIVTSVGKTYKLIITGYIQPEVLRRLKIFCRKLKIENNVLFLGYIPREKRLDLVARSKMMLYPSHVDAFPYAVLEALYLNTPIVAYDIPALKFYYSGLEGVTLVRESDVDALIQESVATIHGKYSYVHKPTFRKSWGEIMDVEVSLIKKLLSKDC